MKPSGQTRQRRGVGMAGPLAPTLAALLGVSAWGCAAGEASRGEAATPMTLVERSSLRERAIEVLEAAALGPRPLLRANALEGLQGAPSRCGPVARAGLADENAGVRFAAAMTTGRLELHGSTPLVRPLTGDPDRRVRAAAIFALAALGQDVDRSPLSAMLLEGTPADRATAAFVLGEMGDPSAVPLLRDGAARLSAVAARQDSAAAAAMLRLQIAEALAKLGDPAGIQTVRAALYPAAAEDFEGAVLAAQILGELGATETARELVELLERTPPDERRMGDPATWTFVYPKEFRLAAARALAKMGETGGRYVARMHADDPDPAIRAQAAFLLGALGEDRDLRALGGLLGDADAGVRVAAASAVLAATPSPGT